MIKSPLPQHNGINASKLVLPKQGNWETISQYVLERFPHIPANKLLSRFEKGEIVANDGTKISTQSKFGSQDTIWYYRQLPKEKPIPFAIKILYQNEHLLVVDKPHFLPTTPNGRYLQETALTRLRKQLKLPELIPIHRLDRMTAGVLLLSINPATRGAYQTLFEKKQITKTYEALTQHQTTLQLPHAVRNRLKKSKNFLLTQIVPGEPNSETKIISAQSLGSLTRYILQPTTGKTHQIRIHMAGLGLGILNDTFYPTLLPDQPDDYTKPLQLLAKKISFQDPIINKPVTYETTFQLSP